MRKRMARIIMRMILRRRTRMRMRSRVMLSDQFSKEASHQVDV